MLEPRVTAAYIREQIALAENHEAMMLREERLRAAKAVPVLGRALLEAREIMQQMVDEVFNPFKGNPDRYHDGLMRARAFLADPPPPGDAHAEERR